MNIHREELEHQRKTRLQLNRGQRNRDKEVWMGELWTRTQKELEETVGRIEPTLQDPKWDSVEEIPLPIPACYDFLHQGRVYRKLLCDLNPDKPLLPRELNEYLDTLRDTDFDIARRARVLRVSSAWRILEAEFRRLDIGLGFYYGTDSLHKDYVKITLRRTVPFSTIDFTGTTDAEWIDAYFAHWADEVRETGSFRWQSSKLDLIGDCSLPRNSEQHGLLLEKLNELSGYRKLCEALAQRGDKPVVYFDKGEEDLDWGESTPGLGWCITAQKAVPPPPPQPPSPSLLQRWFGNT